MSFDITSPGTPTMVFLQSLGRGIHRGIFSSFCAPPFVYLAWSGHRVRYRLYLEKSVLHGASMVLFISVGSLENLFKTDTHPIDSKETLKSTPKTCIKKHQIVCICTYIYIYIIYILITPSLKIQNKHQLDTTPTHPSSFFRK